MSSRIHITAFRYFFMAVLAIMLGLLWSCREEVRPKPANPAKQLKEPLINANREVVRTETEQISDFLKRYKWDVAETGSGLRYMVYHHGDGPEVQKFQEVTLDYAVTFLNGDTAYTSREKGRLVFVPGKAQVISGLEEGILLLRQGDKAKFIIPSHLAFGLIGDQDRIGSKATLVYDVELLKIKK